MFLYFIFQRKCDLYWPAALNNPQTYGLIEVTLTNEDIQATHTIRTFKVIAVINGEKNSFNNNLFKRRFAISRYEAIPAREGSRAVSVTCCSTTTPTGRTTASPTTRCPCSHSSRRAPHQTGRQTGPSSYTAGLYTVLSKQCAVFNWKTFEAIE